MIKILVPLPKKITIACSGGVDSMAVVDFLKRKHDVTLAYFNHGTSHGEEAFKFVTNYCTDNNLPMMYGKCRSEKGKEESQEEYWRRERYEFLSELGPVITCHHLDDCVETFIWSSLHGTPKVIPLTRNNVLRPFLTTRKDEFKSWCLRHDVPWIEDKSNQDTKYMRNYVRNVLMPQALHVNPGLHTLVKKIIEGKQNS
jgi:tRNA(Ile)-lysidine synthase